MVFACPVCMFLQEFSEARGRPVEGSICLGHELLFFPAVRESWAHVPVQVRSGKYSSMIRWSCSVVEQKTRAQSIHMYRVEPWRSHVLTAV